MLIWDHSSILVHCLLLLYLSSCELQQPNPHEAPFTKIYSCDKGRFGH